jgi:ABC-type Mn2+/Zn2+ transport system ATPase subunit
MRDRGAVTGTLLLQADGLAAGYAGRAVLTEVSFALRAGERVGVLGPNGGGKTTLFRTLLGELPALGGRLEVSSRCAVVPQTERSRLDFPVSALDAVDLGALAGATFGDLSGGQRQRVLVARALVQDAPVVLLDEPFTGLDATSAERLEALLRRLAAEGRGLLVASHDVEQARRWDRVLCLNRRQIAFGPPDVLTREVLEATYGGDVVPIDCAVHGTDHVVLPPHHHDHARGS